MDQNVVIQMRHEASLQRRKNKVHWKVDLTICFKVVFSKDSISYFEVWFVWKQKQFSEKMKLSKASSCEINFYGWRNKMRVREDAWDGTKSMLWSFSWVYIIYLFFCIESSIYEKTFIHAYAILPHYRPPPPLTSNTTTAHQQHHHQHHHPPPLTTAHHQHHRSPPTPPPTTNTAKIANLPPINYPQRNPTNATATTFYATLYTTTHPNHSLTPLTHTTHPHHSPTPLTHTTHPHHSPTPLTHTTHPHHSPTPPFNHSLIHTTHPHRSPTPLTHHHSHDPQPTPLNHQPTSSTTNPPLYNQPTPLNHQPTPSTTNPPLNHQPTFSTTNPPLQPPTHPFNHQPTPFNHQPTPSTTNPPPSTTNPPPQPPTHPLNHQQSISVSVSVLTLTAISTERYYAICHPLQFRSTKKRAKIVIAFIWLFSLLISSPELFLLTIHPFKVQIIFFSFFCFEKFSFDRFLSLSSFIVFLL